MTGMYLIYFPHKTVEVLIHCVGFLNFLCDILGFVQFAGSSKKKFRLVFRGCRFLYLDELKMNIDSSIGINQQHTLSFEKASNGLVDDLSVIWRAAEALTSPNLEARKAGFDRLVKLRAHFQYPLVAYLFATRLADPDLKFRSHIVRTVVELLRAQEAGNHVLEAARIRLADTISQMRIRQIFALLQGSDTGLSNDDDVAIILNYNPYAGDHLCSILSDWHAPINIRKKAVIFIERVGFVDALPVLERVASRLLSRYSDKQMSLWELADGNGEASLLPVVENALGVLRAP